MLRSPDIILRELNSYQKADGEIAEPPCRAWRERQLEEESRTGREGEALTSPRLGVARWNQEEFYKTGRNACVFVLVSCYL